MRGLVPGEIILSAETPITCRHIADKHFATHSIRMGVDMGPKVSFPHAAVITTSARQQRDVGVHVRKPVAFRFETPSGFSVGRGGRCSETRRTEAAVEGAGRRGVASTAAFDLDDVAVLSATGRRAFLRLFSRVFPFHMHHQERIHFRNL